MNKKKLLAPILAGTMLLGLLAPMPADAATNKVAKIPVNFTGGGVESNDSAVELWFAGEPGAVSEGYTVSYKLYVPEPMIKGDCGLFLAPMIRLFDGSNWLGDAEGQAVDFRSDGKMTGYAGDKVVNIDYASAEKASGYWVISYNGKIAAQDIPADASKASVVTMNVKLDICGWNITAENQAVYLDDVKIAKADGTLTFDQNFDATTVSPGRVFVAPNMEYTDAKEVTTTTLPSLTATKTLKVAKTSLSVKVGKKVTIKATVKPKAKITYKSSNKKIATVTSKGVVTGKKAGKAVITVKGNGKTVKVKVTVKGKK